MREVKRGIVCTSPTSSDLCTRQLVGLVTALKQHSSLLHTKYIPHLMCTAVLFLHHASSHNHITARNHHVQALKKRSTDRSKNWPSYKRSDDSCGRHSLPLPHLHKPFSPSPISRTVSVDVKHHVYFGRPCLRSPVPVADMLYSKSKAFFRVAMTYVYGERKEYSSTSLSLWVP